MRLDRRVGILIKGIDVSATHLAAWNGKKVEVYEFTQGGRMDMVGSFPSSSTAIALHGQNLYQASGSKIEVCNMNGVAKKGAISIPDADGRVTHIDISGSFMAVATTKGLLRMYKLSGRAQEIGGGARFALPGSKKLIGDVSSIRCNADGTRVSVLAAGRGANVGQTDTRVYVWHLGRDEVQPFDFGAARYPTSHFGTCRSRGCSPSRRSSLGLRVGLARRRRFPNRRPPLKCTRSSRQTSRQA